MRKKSGTKTYSKSSPSKRTMTRASKSPGRGMRDASARPKRTRKKS